jgi:hypothetical protein
MKSIALNGTTYTLNQRYPSVITHSSWWGNQPQLSDRRQLQAGCKRNVPRQPQLLLLIRSAAETADFAAHQEIVEADGSRRGGVFWTPPGGFPVS